MLFPILPHAFHSGRAGSADHPPSIHPLRSENHYLVFVNVAPEMEELLGVGCLVCSWFDGPTRDVGRSRSVDRAPRS